MAPLQNFEICNYWRPLPESKSTTIGRTITEKIDWIGFCVFKADDDYTSYGEQDSIRPTVYPASLTAVRLFRLCK